MLKIYKYVNQFFYAIFISKFVFYKPNQSDILLYDQGSTFNGLVKKTLKNYKISIILVRLEEINLYVVISLIIKLKFLNKGSLFFNYIVEYCEHIRPKLILTSNNLDLKFYKLKESLSYKVKIGYVQRTPIYANHLLRSSYPAMLNVAKSILIHGRSYETDKDCLSIKDILKLIPGTK